MNRRFEFRLSRLRRVREIDEQVARAVWTAAEAESHEASVLLEEARTAIAEAREDLSTSLDPASGTTVDPRSVLVALESIQGMLDDVHRRREDALTLRAQADRLAEAWREREVERKALVELENRARERHRAELEREENAEMDEQNLMRDARRRRRERESDSSAAETLADNVGVSDHRIPAQR
jgi:flagellar export protein FliJ